MVGSNASAIVVELRQDCPEQLREQEIGTSGQREISVTASVTASGGGRERAPATRIACLPWYELPETRHAQASFWSTLARCLRSAGVSGVPRRLTLGPPVPGFLTDSRLLFGQCCGYDLIYGFAGSVQLVATPCYDAPGCDGPDYRSFVLVRGDDPSQCLDDLRGRVCVVNAFNSHSGTNALRALVAPLSRNGRFFSTVKVSGAHMNSLALLRAGEADVMAMDCILHALLRRHRPAALNGLRVLIASEPAPAPPFITAAAADRSEIDRLRAALRAALSDDAGRGARSMMLLKGVRQLSLHDYGRIVEIEGMALRHGYTELHATSPAVAR